VQIQHEVDNPADLVLWFVFNIGFLCVYDQVEEEAEEEEEDEEEGGGVQEQPLTAPNAI
jgi:hypothetical protein